MKKLYTALFIFCLGLSFVSAQSLNFVGKKTYGFSISDVWGYVHPSGTEYALVGTTSGMSIVDVSTDPTSPSEVQFVPKNSSVWQDVKVWENHAYMVVDVNGQAGLLIVDLSDLPNSVSSLTWDENIDGIPFGLVHNIFVDENGILYACGGDFANGGVAFLDLNPDPNDPTLVGTYTDDYVHDLYVKDNMLYTAEVYGGKFKVVNIADKENPAVLGSAFTPNDFTHNVWLSDDGNTLFTTDEKEGAYVTAFDISDPSDINELDRLRTPNFSNVIPHNTFVLGDLLVTSYYTEGVWIFDASDPSNLTPLAQYDTSPSSGGGFAGCWGVYPFLPSGRILATDSGQGLFVLEYDETPVGIEDVLEEKQFAVNPNPIQNRAVITFKDINQLSNKYNDVKIEVSNIVGKKVAAINDIQTSEVTFERNNLTSGIYFFQLKADNNTLATIKAILN